MERVFAAVMEAFALDRNVGDSPVLERLAGEAGQHDESVVGDVVVDD